MLKQRRANLMRLCSEAKVAQFFFERESRECVESVVVHFSCSCSSIAECCCCLCRKATNVLTTKNTYTWVCILYYFNDIFFLSLFCTLYTYINHHHHDHKCVYINKLRASVNFSLFTLKEKKLLVNMLIVYFFFCLYFLFLLLYLYFLLTPKSIDFTCGE